MVNSNRYTDIEARVRAAGYNLGQFFAAAELDRSTWTRWRNGETGPTLRNWERVQDTINELEAAK